MLEGYTHGVASHRLIRTHKLTQTESHTHPHRAIARSESGRIISHVAPEDTVFSPCELFSSLSFDVVGLLLWFFKFLSSVRQDETL